MPEKKITQEEQTEETPQPIWSKPTITRLALKQTYPPKVGSFPDGTAGTSFNAP